MSAMTIIMMSSYLLIVGGLLVLAALHLAKNDDRTAGTLGSKNLDDLPEYTPPS